MCRVLTLPRIAVLFSALIFTALTPSRSLAYDPWTVPESSASVYATFTHETFRKFYAGGEKIDWDTGRFNQDSWLVSADYGLTDYLTLDVSTGYTIADGAEAGERDGLADSQIATRTRILDEFQDSDLTLSVLVALVIPGTYGQRPFPVSPGDGAYGAETGLIAGRMLGDSGFGILGGVSYLTREANVPNVWRFNAGGLYNFSDTVSLAIQYHGEHAVSGAEFSDADYDPMHPELLKDISDQIEVSLSSVYENWLLGILYAHTLDGRNTGAKDIISVTAGYRIN